MHTLLMLLLVLACALVVVVATLFVLGGPDDGYIPRHKAGADTGPVDDPDDIVDRQYR